MKKKIYEHGGMSGAALKTLACCTMLIDHIGYSIIWPLYVDACVVDGVYMMGDLEPVKAKVFYALYVAMRGIGRMAFPVFSFLLVQGFLRTHSVKAYILRLVAFAIISEIPYDLVMSGQIVNMEQQNVMWTLAVGVIAMCGLNYASRYRNGWKQILYAAIMQCAVLVTALGMTDGGGAGILFIFFFYLFPKRNMPFWISMWVLLIWMTYFDFPYEIAAFSGVVITGIYNNKKGRINKYTFYVFYPLHLLLLAVVAFVVVK